MDGHGDDGLQDLFPQPDPQFPPGGFDYLSQSELPRAPRSGLEALDLNSQAEEFPDIDSYSDYLRGDGVPRARESRTLGLRVARAGGRGGGRSRAGGGSRSAGGSRGAGGSRLAGGSRGSGGGRGGGGRGGGGRATRSLFPCGTLPEVGAGSGGPGGGRGSRSRPTGGEAAAVDAENVVDIDDQNDDNAADVVEVIFPGSKVC